MNKCNSCDWYYPKTSFCEYYLKGVEQVVLLCPHCRNKNEEIPSTKEYIVTVSDEKDYEEVFVGSIKQNPELIRCKDCIHYDGHYCHNKWWGDGYGNYTSPIKSKDGHCDWAERRGEE